MALSRAEYLNRVTSGQKIKSIEVGEAMQGSSPPSVFIGAYSYPKVFVGPMLSAETTGTAILDFPEGWLSEGFNSAEIASLRLQLVRGKQQAGIKDFNNKLVRKVQEIALAKRPVYSNAEFAKKPAGISYGFDESHAPFGPSAELKSFEKENVKFEPKLEKAHDDTDLKSTDAVLSLYGKGLQFTQIQKAFSVGAFGLEKNRRLVPTRWSITAVDNTIGKYLVGKVKENPLLDCYQVYEFSALDNYFAVLFVPNVWQYEWTEAFIHVLGNEEMIFSDWEPNSGKKEYSHTGGCFYSVRLAVAEKLVKLGRQATALVFREAYTGYIPLGVWACREITRNALKQTLREFTDLKSALDYVDTKLQLGVQRFRQESVLLKGLQAQQSLARFF